MRKPGIILHKWALGLLFAAYASSCGTSVFVHVEKKNTAEDATLMMEKDQPDNAIALLNKGLANDPGNPQLTALLSSATAQKYGIDTISIAMQMAKNSTSSSTASSSSAAGGSNGITALFGALPEATSERISGINEAIGIMESIPAELRTPADFFMLTMMHTAVVALITKQFDKDGDGLVSPVEMLSIAGSDATAILTSLLAAQESMASASGATGSSGSAALANVAKIHDAIKNSPGSTDQEKLLNYLNPTSKTLPTTIPATTK